MILKEIVSALHSDKLVVYDGYEGEDQEAVAALYGIQGKRLVELIYEYGNREVAVLECADDILFVWLTSE